MSPKVLSGRSSAEAVKQRGRTLSVLTIAQALYLSGISIDMTLTGVVGYGLAPTPLLATIPFALISVAAGAATYPVALFMESFGRRAGFMVGSAVAAAGGLLSFAAVWSHSFLLLSIGVAFIGVYQAVAGYYRYAAADAHPPQQRARAISTVLSGGIVAAIAGPFLASWASDLLPVQFAGAYLFATVLALVSLGVLRALPAAPPCDRLGTAARDAAPEQGRPRLGKVLADFRFVTGLVGSSVAFFVMSLTMTAAPVAAIHNGHGVDDGATVIQFHMIGMYATALVSGRLAQRFGIVPVQLLGTALMAAGLVVGVSGDSSVQLAAALGIIGVGWNLLYVTSSALISAADDELHRSRMQAIGELGTLCGAAIGAMSAGVLLAAAGWTTTGAVLLIPLLAVALLALQYVRVQRRNGANLG